MFWEDDETRESVEIPTDIIDLLFSIECRALPVDHAYALSCALHQALPWLADDDRTGIHEIHVAASQNGWERPADIDQLLYLSRRTKLTLRVPVDRLDDARALGGRTLDVDGHVMKIGTSKPKPLSRMSTLFARHVVAKGDDDETRFLQRMAAHLKVMDIPMKKALCGIEHALSTPQGPVHTRSLLVASLRPEDSVRLQREGLGTHRKMGCGIFIPHKGIDPVKKTEDDSLI